MVLNIQRIKTALSVVVIYVIVMGMSAHLYAQNQDVIDPKLEEIVISSRYRIEHAQDVPDSMTVFNAGAIQSSGIDSIHDFIALTPNMIVRETFRSGETLITIRGVTTAQQGWAPIAYVVDGVKTAALDAINQGVLFDIERIEVLKGPQGGLYGAGAIAGAVNVITKTPTNEFQGSVKTQVGEGSDYSLSAAVAGPIIADKLLYRLALFARDSDGLVDTTDGDDIDFHNQEALRARLLFYATDDISIDFRGSYSEINAGAARQDFVADEALIDHFDSTSAPGPRRGIIGEEDRRFNEMAIRLMWETSAGVLTSTSAYQDIDQTLFGSASWDKPPGVISIFEPPPFLLHGDIALPGQAIDDFQVLTDDFDIFTQDFRLSSSSDQPLRWLVGAEYLRREAITRLGLGHLIAPMPATRQYLSNRWDERNDKLWGVYTQINYDLSDDLELTVVARYDKNRYDTRQFDPQSRQTIADIDAVGNLVGKQFAKDSKFQPKLQLAYHWTKDLMLYSTWAKGFRSGFFNTGRSTRAEQTDNVEIGFKQTAHAGRVQINGAVFYTDYSDQQLTSAIAQAPFRVTTNIPKSTIKGAEFDITAKVGQRLKINAALGYIDTEINDIHLNTPATPDWTANVGILHSQAIDNGINWINRLDYIYQGEMYLHLEAPPLASEYRQRFWVDAKEYLNIRSSIELKNWRFSAFVNNVLQTQQATDFTDFGGKFVRSYNKPRAWGIAAEYRF